MKREEKGVMQTRKYRIMDKAIKEQLNQGKREGTKGGKKNGRRGQEEVEVGSMKAQQGSNERTEEWKYG